jgi:hypothetical protein
MCTDVLAAEYALSTAILSKTTPLTRNPALLRFARRFHLTPHATERIILRQSARAGLRAQEIAAFT